MAAGVRVGCLFTACLQEWTTGRGLELTNQLENLSSGLVSTERPPLWAVCVRRRCRRQLGEVGHGEGGNLGVLLLQPAASFALSTLKIILPLTASLGSIVTCWCCYQQRYLLNSSIPSLISLSQLRCLCHHILWVADDKTYIQQHFKISDELQKETFGSSSKS